MSGTGTTIVSSSIGTVFQPRQFFAQRLARQVHAAVVHRAGDVGEIDPLEEAVRPPRAVGEPLRCSISPSLIVIISPGSSELDALGAKSPRFNSATLSLAAANSGPSIA